VKTRILRAMGVLFCFVSATALADIQKPASSKDGKYFSANGDPTYNISPDGTVDWYTFSGFIRYNSECLRCHGPDGMGSSYAPALLDSLKTMDYDTFLATVASGRQNLSGGQEKVMPALGLNKNVMCYVDDIFVYLKARGDEAAPRNRPAKHAEKPKSWKDAEDSCMGTT
jgi:methanol metabolism-related c-type cytochrome